MHLLGLILFILQVDLAALRSEANADLQNGLFDDARTKLERILQLEPANDAVRTQLAFCYINLARYEDAIPIYLAAIERKSDDINLRVDLASLLDATGNFADAEQHIQEALRLSSTDPNIRLAVGFFYLRRNETDKAYPYLIAATKAGASSSKIRNVLRLTRLFGDRLTEHRDKLRQIQLVGRTPEVFFMARAELARSYWEEGDLDNAASSFSSMDSSTNLELALIYFEKKDYGKAAALFTLLTFEDHNNVDYLYLLGRCQVQTRSYGKAIKTLEDALRIAPETPELLMELATAHFLNADHEHAAQILTRYVAYDPAHASSYFLLAESYDKLGNRQQALLNYQKFLRLDDESEPSRTVRARTRERVLQKALPVGAL
jgi:predicted Zn-dependent protease